MANWCNNMVEFEFRNEELVKELLTIIDRYKKEESGQLPEGCKEDAHYANKHIFEPDLSGDGIYFFFLTKWAPAIGTMQFLSDKYNVPFKMEYAELGCMCAGIVEYSPEDGIWHKEWDGDDDDIIEDEECDLYMWNGNEYESKEEAIFAKLRS